MTGKDPIDQLFKAARENEPYIDDAGFTAGVIARLPSAKGLPFWKDGLITLIFTLLGVLLALHFFPAGELARHLPTSFVISPLSIAGMLALAGLIGGSAYWAAANDRLL